MSVIEYKVCDRCGSKLNGITDVNEFSVENPGIRNLEVIYVIIV